uniref:Uncharacterized protein n=1 Tax=Ascaris lumbricoides TaxID=6252 RepID=A0A0M3HQR5_ASCLU
MEPRSMQNQPGSVLGSEKCVDQTVSHSVYKRPIFMKKQVLLPTEACKSSTIDNGKEALASPEEPSVIEPPRYIGKSARIASQEGSGSQLLAQSGDNSAKCSKPDVALAEKESPVNEPGMSYATPVMKKVVPKFGRR